MDTDTSLVSILRGFWLSITAPRLLLSQIYSTKQRITTVREYLEWTRIILITMLSDNLLFMLSVISRRFSYGLWTQVACIRTLQFHFHWDVLDMSAWQLAILADRVKTFASLLDSYINVCWCSLVDNLTLVPWVDFYRQN